MTRWFSAAAGNDLDPAKVIHDRLEQCRQRVNQIALGFEDCNDSDTLPHDPLLKTVGDRPPSDEHGLSSLPTLSRFENSVDWMTIRRLIRAFERDLCGFIAGLHDRVHPRHRRH